MFRLVFLPINQTLTDDVKKSGTPELKKLERRNSRGFKRDRGCVKYEVGDNRSAF